LKKTIAVETHSDKVVPPKEKTKKIRTMNMSNKKELSVTTRTWPEGHGDIESLLGSI
jgi:hypothetical protein